MIKKKTLRKRKKKKVKFYVEAGLRCQGRGEKRYIKECVRYKRELPTKPKRIETPFGYYTPDFELKEKFIEIKSLHTFLVCIGEASYKNIGDPSNLQFKKIEWVSLNIKPIEIVIYFSARETKVSCKELEILPHLTITSKGGYVPKKKKLD